jgi:hypothetical protein
MNENDVFQRVAHALAEVEATRNVCVLYACEPGSRAWGFASRDSEHREQDAPDGERRLPRLRKQNSASGEAIFPVHPSTKRTNTAALHPHCARTRTAPVLTRSTTDPP